jgi:hypothetical protein
MSEPEYWAPSTRSCPRRSAPLTVNGQESYAQLSSDEAKPIDDIVENTGLNSSDVLATLLGIGDERLRPAAAGKLFNKIRL